MDESISYDSRHNIMQQSSKTVRFIEPNMLLDKPHRFGAESTQNDPRLMLAML